MKEKSLISKFREAGQHTLIYGLGSVLQTLLGFILIPLYTRYYTAEMYGVFSLVTLCGTFAGSIFFFGASSALSRSYFDYSDLDGKKKAVSTAFCISLCGVLIQVLLALVFSHSISYGLFQKPDFSPHILLILSSSALAFMNTLFYVLHRLERKSQQVTILSIFSFLLSAMLILLFLVRFQMGIMAPILGEFIGRSVLLCLQFFLSIRYLSFEISLTELRLQLRYGIPTVFIALSYYVLDWVDRLFINYFGSLNDVGIYSLGYKFGMSIQILLIIPFSQIWNPMRMEYRYDANADRFFRLGLTYYALVGFLMTVGISVFSKEILMIFSGRDEYLLAFRVIPFVMLGHLLYGSINIIDNGIIFERKVQFHAYIFWFGVLVNVLLNYWWVPRLGYMGAAYSTLATYMILVLLVFFISNKLYTVHFEWDRLLNIAGWGVAAIVLGNVIGLQPLWAHVGLKGVVVVAFAYYLYCCVLRANERDGIFQLWKGKEK